MSGMAATAEALDMGGALIPFPEDTGREIRDVSVDPQAYLSRKAGGGPLEFTFRYRGVLFAGQAESTVDSSQLKIHANLGSLPYTMESSYRRANALAIVRAAGKAMGGRVWVSPEQRIFLIDTKRFDEPMSPRSLIANAVRLVLEARPYLDLLEVVVAPPLSESA